MSTPVYRAALFDLLTALLDSWSLWSKAARSEEAGYVKPHPRPHRMAVERLGCEAEHVLFVAGSAGDVSGASAVGMPVHWRNRMRLLPPDATSQPR